MINSKPTPRDDSSKSGTAPSLVSPTTTTGTIITSPPPNASQSPSLVSSTSTSASTTAVTSRDSSRRSSASLPPYCIPLTGLGSRARMSVRPFPRTNWDGVVFNPHSSDPQDMTEWAGREASRRWAAAIAAGHLGNLDTIDFGVAVFDHVCEFVQKSRPKQALMTATTWILTTNVALEFSFKAAEWCLYDAFPKNPRVGGLLNRTRVFGFVREALNWQWVGGIHGGGKGGPNDRPPMLGYGEDWIERFMPGYVRPKFDRSEMDEEDASMLRRVHVIMARQSPLAGPDWIKRMGNYQRQ
ncbi:hypothetical protein CspeluHIS016_0106110 [Cutaneotrichosporon spelunceum]|uniref:Uncharacterized protein n=1 Tax=Cutaneotrichosporon spelunceum TaxID=1672016 RepID=A0AAD3TPH5_9TREE|nr:hypothetical protein CspeluHIS016_0106110 [Cutaneotrichosporon spelunceum]